MKRKKYLVVYDIAAAGSVVVSAANADAAIDHVASQPPSSLTNTGQYEVINVDVVEETEAEAELST